MGSSIDTSLHHPPTCSQKPYLQYPLPTPVSLFSSTLSPMDSFASELGTVFDARMEGMHVVDLDRQVRLLPPPHTLLQPPHPHLLPLLLLHFLLLLLLFFTLLLPLLLLLLLLLSSSSSPPYPPPPPDSPLFLIFSSSS